MSGESPNSTAADKIVELAQMIYRFGQTLEGEPFAVSKTGANVALFIRSGDEDGFQRHLARECRKAHKKIPSRQQTADALQILLGDCYEASPEPCSCRVAPCSDNGIAVDLGTPDGKAVVIYPNEPRMRVVDRSPVLFRRTALISEMPEPAPGGSLDEIPRLLGLSDRHWQLALGWLLAAYFRDMPHPILAIFGPAGAGKSFLAKLLVRLSDPSPCPLRSVPRSEEDWHVSASSGWVYAMDNLSDIKSTFSESLCKAATGDAIVLRKKYTNKDLAVSSIRVPVILTAIEVGALRGDLGDRFVLLELSRRQKVLTERRLEAIIQERLPYWLGALFDAVSRVQERLAFAKVDDDLPRMADFAQVLACADAAGVTVGAAEAYEQNRCDTAMEVADGDELAEAIATHVQGLQDGRWDGTATELLRALNGLPGLTRGPEWPKAANALSRRLKRLAPVLSSCGVRYQTHQDGTTRKWLISLLLSQKEKKSLGSLGSLATPQESAEKHVAPPNDDRTIPERCSDTADCPVSPETGSPSDDRAIPERYPGELDRRMAAGRADDSRLRPVPHVAQYCVGLEACGKCGGDRFVDIPMHDGRSRRRHCADCDAFVGFPAWNPLTSDKHTLRSATHKE